MRYSNKKRLLDMVQRSTMQQYSKVHKVYKLYKITPDNCDISILERFRIGKGTFISFKLKYKDIEDKWAVRLK